MKRQKQVIKRMYIASDDAGNQEKWLADILNRSGMNMSNLADKCHITKQSINNLANGRCRISFAMVVAICYVTGLDDPEEVWHALSL